MTNQVRFVHCRNPNAKLAGMREFTIAYEYDPVANTFFAGFAYCSLKDNYSKKVGNAKALERLQAGVLGGEVGREYYLPIHNATLFNTHSEMRQFAVTWGLQFA